MKGQLASPSTMTILQAMLDDISSWCPVCFWRGFPNEVDPGFSCPDCGSATLSPPDPTTASFPHLLTAGVPPLEDQVDDARSGDYSFDPLFVCGVLYRTENNEVAQLGCILIDTSPWRAWADGIPHRYFSYILFRDRQGWRKAYRIARLLKDSQPSRVATVGEDDVRDLKIIMTERHVLNVGGQYYGNQH